MVAKVDIELVLVDTGVRAVVVMAVVGLVVIVIFYCCCSRRSRQSAEVVTLLGLAAPLTVAVALVVTIKL